MSRCRCDPWLLYDVSVWEIDCRGAELTIVYQRGDEQTDGDAQLVRTDDETTNPLGQRLGLVHGNLNRDETNTKTSEESTSNEHALLSGSDLENDTEVERNSSTDDDTPLATSPVGNETSSQSTDEGTDGENRDDQGDFSVGSRVVEFFDPVGHLLNTRNGT